MTEEKHSVLFVCTHNSARSQMAEALLRHHFADRFVAYSAGTMATFVKKPVLVVLQEKAIETEGLYSKSISDLGGLRAQTVVTVCDDAKEACPYLPGSERTIHHSFPDPTHMGQSEEENLAAFRRVRDNIENWIIEFFARESAG